MLKPTKKQKQLIRKICHRFGWKTQKFETQQQAQAFIDKHYDEYFNGLMREMAYYDAFSDF